MAVDPGAAKGAAQAANSAKDGAKNAGAKAAGKAGGGAAQKANGKSQPKGGAKGINASDGNVRNSGGTMADQEREDEERAKEGTKAVVKAVGQAATKNYAGAAVTLASNAKNIFSLIERIFLIGTAVLVIVVAMFSHPWELLINGSSAADEESFRNTYADVMTKTADIVNASYKSVHSEALAASEELKSSYGSRSEDADADEVINNITATVSPASDTYVISKALANRYMAINQVITLNTEDAIDPNAPTVSSLDEIDSETGYAPIEKETVPETDTGAEDETETSVQQAKTLSDLENSEERIRKMYGRNFFRAMKEYSKGMFVLGETVENVERKEIVTVIEEDGAEAGDGTSTIEFTSDGTRTLDPGTDGKKKKKERVTIEYTGTITTYVQTSSVPFLEEEQENAVLKISSEHPGEERSKIQARFDDQVEYVRKQLNEIAGINDDFGIGAAGLLGSSADYYYASKEAKRIADEACRSLESGRDDGVFGMCAGWVSDIYSRAFGYRPAFTGCSYHPGQNNACDMWATFSGRGDLEVGMIIAVQHTGTSGDGYEYGHVGIYVGGGMVVHRTAGRVQQESVEDWISEFDTYNQVRWGWPLNVTVPPPSKPAAGILGTISWAVNKAADPYCGYGNYQFGRHGRDGERESDGRYYYDCSSFVYHALTEGGHFNISGANTSPQGLYNALRAAGWECFSAPGSPEGLLPGDVLINTDPVYNHAVLFIGKYDGRDNQIVSAETDDVAFEDQVLVGGFYNFAYYVCRPPLEK